MTVGDGRVGAGHADGGDLGLSEGICRSDGHAGTVGAQGDHSACGDDGGSGGHRVLLQRAVVGDVQLHGVLLTGNVDLIVQGVGILDAQHFLLAAAAVVAGQGLIHADDDLVVDGIQLHAGGIAVVKAGGLRVIVLDLLGLDELEFGAVGCGLLDVGAVLDGIAGEVELDLAGNGVVIGQGPQRSGHVHGGQVSALGLGRSADGRHGHVVGVEAQCGDSRHNVVAAIVVVGVGVGVQPCLEAVNELGRGAGSGVVLIKESRAVHVQTGVGHAVQNDGGLPGVTGHDGALHAQVVGLGQQAGCHGDGVGGKDHIGVLINGLLQIVGEVGGVGGEGLHHNGAAQLLKGGLEAAGQTQRIGVAFLGQHVGHGGAGVGVLVAIIRALAVAALLAAGHQAQRHDQRQKHRKKLLHFIFLLCFLRRTLPNGSSIECTHFIGTPLRLQL